MSTISINGAIQAPAPSTLRFDAQVILNTLRDTHGILDVLEDGPVSAPASAAAGDGLASTLGQIAGAAGQLYARIESLQSRIGTL